MVRRRSEAPPGEKSQSGWTILAWLQEQEGVEMILMRDPCPNTPSKPEFSKPFLRVQVLSPGSARVYERFSWFIGGITPYQIQQCLRYRSRVANEDVEKPDRNTTTLASEQQTSHCCLLIVCLLFFMFSVWCCFVFVYYVFCCLFWGGGRWGGLALQIEPA